ncbi:MAG: alanyl-tRNA synthetase [Planctomycetota bacterium]|jgi:alanyl-tRNA synthetase
MPRPDPGKPTNSAMPLSETTPPTAAAIRQSFLDFFEGQQHRAVPSSPVFPMDDPTLLFTNAGMNQFKDVFLGTGTREYERAVDSQKCIRVQGKHNDLEEVGVDTYHHTFFEMLGNWSFGDYFKADAIQWAWTLLTEVWGMPKERLWVSVFSGDEKDGLPADEEAEKIWLESTDIDPSHVLRFDKTDNFWEMGDTGPCGPCSEIHIDRGGPGSDPKDGADPAIGVNAGNERFIELWNLVFMQFNRQDDGSLVELPAKSVDTGMGFERVLAVLQGKLSNYDTDLFQPIFRRLEQICGKLYEDGNEQADVAFRVCADHVRAVTVSLADGALPSNEGRGYVLRRLIRRASRYGLQVLGQKQPFLFELAATVSEIMGDAYPEIRARLEHVQLVIKSEEQSFRKTLERGLVQFEKLAGDMAAGSTIDGGEAYELYATYGFPQDLVELMARERELKLDDEGWQKARKAHSEVSRSEGRFTQLLSAEQLTGLSATDGGFHNEAGGQVEGTGTITRFLAGEGDEPDRMVLDSSPFYPEGGGQVGDAGSIEAVDGSFRFRVEDTKKVGDVAVHLGQSEGTPTEGAQVRCLADQTRRNAVRANHTATHLLHRALRDVLGEHVTQQGSYVGADRLRFDFSHPKGMTPEQVADVEQRVNTEILGNHEVATSVEGFQEAKDRGVMALFGEKYGERVRVVQVGDGSIELCGGTHVERSGDIGPFVVLTEKAIQAGVRRIEGLTHQTALSFLQGQRRILTGIAMDMKAKTEEIPERLAALQGQLKEAKKKQKQAASGDAGALFDTVKAALETRAGVQYAVIDLGDVDAGGLRDLGERLQGLGGDLCVVALGRAGGKVPFLILCLGEAQKKGLGAGSLAKELAGILGGGGGGRPEVAQGQGLNPDRAGEALAHVRDKVLEALS